tara:strand:- start:26199 stop:27860 length:1662 start_codon:yes stop_codon:yes gene_type:complete
MFQRNKIPYLILILTLLISYSEHFISPYIQLIDNNKLESFKNFRGYQVSCDKTKLKTCYELYELPVSKLKGYNFFGVGVFTNTLRAYCELTEIKSEPVKYNIDIFNVYQVIDLSKLNCSDKIYIIVEENHKLVRKGYQYGPQLLGSKSVLNKAKWLLEFFYKDIFIFILLSLFLLFFIRQKLLKMNLVDFRDLYFINQVPFFIPYLFLLTGFLQILLPTLKDSYVIVYLIWILGFIAHSRIILLVLQSKKYTYYILFISVTLVEFLINGTIYLFYISFLAIILFGFYLSIKRKDVRIFLFYSFVLLSLLTTMNIKLHSNGRASTIMFFFLVLYDLFLYLEKLNKKNISIENIRKLMREGANSDYLEFRKLLHDIRAPLSIIEYEVENSKSNLLEDAYIRIKNIIDNNINSKNSSKKDFTKSLLNLIAEKEFIFDIIISFEEPKESIFLNSNVVKDLERVLSNVIDNSIEASKGKDISISIKKNLQTLHILINNSTIIDNATLERLNKGEEFTTKVHGNGLGSSSAYSTISNLYGSIYYKESGEVIIEIPLDKK